MTIDLVFIVALVLLGASVGFFAGLLGIGGGGIMVPILATLFLWRGVATAEVMHLALGTSMASIVATALASARAHHLRQGIEWPVVRWMAPGVIVGTLSATYFVAQLPALLLGCIFALFMFGVAVQMLLGAQPSPRRQLPGPLPLIMAGAGIGGISATVSIGGGTLSVPLLYWHNLPLLRAIGTSSAIGVCIAISGTLGYLWHGWGAYSTDSYLYGFIYMPAVVLISLTSIVTAPLGVSYAYRLPVVKIKKIFAFLLFALSAKMLLSLIS